ncbi:MAG: hypothetical protein HY717_09100 [Planctomycetes bacterium]|nr:hypothetical protein [Planctomycetota bacterium]
MKSTGPPSIVKRAGLCRSLRFWCKDLDFDGLLEAVRAHEHALAAGKGVLKNEHKTAITRVRVRGVSAVVKHYRWMGLRFFLKGLFRAHPGRRSFLNARTLLARNVPAPAPWGLVERSLLGLAAESWLITMDFPQAVELDRYLLRNYSGWDRPRRRRFLAAFAGEIRRLLQSGIRHRDFKTCNVLVLEDQDAWRFGFIDLDDVEALPENAPIARADWVQVLSHLNPSTPKLVSWGDRLRFLSHFPELAAFDRQPLLAEVQEISRRRRRAYFSDAGPVEEDFK